MLSWFDDTFPTRPYLIGFSKELGEVVVKAHLPQYKKTHEGLLTFESRAI